MGCGKPRWAGMVELTTASFRSMATTLRNETPPAASRSRARELLMGLQDSICAGLEKLDQDGRFQEESWDRPEGGGGRSRVMKAGRIFEQGGVNFAEVQGEELPPAILNQRPEAKGHPWFALGTSMVYALALLVLFLVWARAGSMVHVFFPMHAQPHWSELVAFFAIGSAVGSIFASLTFLFSAFSLPMICDRDADAVTAIVTSVNAVLRNKSAMAVWILLIVAITAVGFATALLGLALAIPLLGHATWHAYKDTIDASAWPVIEPA